MTKKYFALTLICATVLAVGCSSDDDDDDMSGGGDTAAVLPAGEDYVVDGSVMLNLLETAASVPTLSSLVSAISNSCPDLGAALASEDARLTVFAPNDDAFLSTEAVAALAVDGVDVCAVIEGHVLVDTVASATDLQSQVGRVATTLAGTTVAIAQDGENLTIGGSVVSGANNFATNGVAHIIDSVILPADEGSTDGTADGGADGTADGGADGGTDGSSGSSGGGGATTFPSLEVLRNNGNTQFVTLYETGNFGGSIEDNTWTIFAPTNAAIDNGVFQTLNADSASANAAVQAHVAQVSAAFAALDSEALGALTTIRMNNTTTDYAVTNVDGVITVGGFEVTELTTPGNAVVYSIDGLLDLP